MSQIFIGYFLLNIKTEFGIDQNKQCHLVVKAGTSIAAYQPNHMDIILGNFHPLPLMWTLLLLNSKPPSPSFFHVVSHFIKGRRIDVQTTWTNEGEGGLLFSNKSIHIRGRGCKLPKILSSNRSSGLYHQMALLVLINSKFRL